jgi:hypothetical protein
MAFMTYALLDLSDSVSSTTLVRQFVWPVPEVTTCAAQWYIQGNAYEGVSHKFPLPSHYIRIRQG